MQNNDHPRIPAKLPERSRAAAAQRLDERPINNTRGVYYPAPHLNPNPRGWRTKRHIKRKKLHRTYLQYFVIDRIGSPWTLLPMDLGVLAAIVVFASLVVGFTAAVNATQTRFHQQVITLPDILPKDSLKMYDKHGTSIYQAIDQGLQTTVPLSKISPNLIHAEIAIEDQTFWTNSGYDITGIVRATLTSLSHGHIVSGGSTITQQLIKNAVVGDQDTAMRKLEEIILAPEATRKFTKEQILSMYLNTIYYGEQAYGGNAAAFTYFNLQDTPTASAASQLDIAQAAMLAGIPSAPIGRDPFLDPHSAFLRVQQVLQQMRLQGYITTEQLRAAIVEVQQPHFLHRGVLPKTLAPHFANYAVNELANVLHLKRVDLSRSGLV